MGKYQAYPEYKDSGVDFLGELPIGWSVLRGKYVFSEFAERSTTGEELLLSVSEYYGVKPRGEVIDEGDYLSRADSLIDYKKCAVNDLVMNIMLAWKCGLGVTKYEGIVSPAYSVFRFGPNAHPDYMHYLLRTSTYTGHFKTRSTGVIDSRLRLYPESFGDVSIVLPTREEQITIANFLDHETAKIDTLIEQQRQLIQLLKEKRQAVISHAVTKGLSSLNGGPNAPMKDSGVEWFGEVPAHWDVCRVKQITKFITSGPRGWSDFLNENGENLFLQSGDLNYKLGLELADAKKVTPPNNAEGVRTKLESGDVVVCITGANTGRVAVTPELVDTVYINQHLSLVRPIKSLMDSDYLGLVLSSSSVKSYFSVTQYGLKEGLSLSNVGESPVCRPPLKEQKEIVQYVGNASDKYDALESFAEKQVELLRERRTALISAAVTGKIDVRNWQAPQQ